MTATDAGTLSGPRQRLVALDLLRGLVIVVMVLDHVRDFLHIDAPRFDPLDPAHTTALLYATRWITHFCAPTFVFLAGTSAWLQRAAAEHARAVMAAADARNVAGALELTVLGFGWSFWIPYLLFLQVIWAIGCSMVALAACVWLPRSGARRSACSSSGAQPARPRHPRAARAVREGVDGAARAGRVVARGRAVCAPGLSGAPVDRGDAARLRHGAGVPAAGAPA
jgi:hypothetical protein